jgi:Ca-activated chloride channel family protein
MGREKRRAWNVASLARIWGALALTAGCGGAPADVDRTVASVATVRGESQLTVEGADAEVVRARSRALPGAVLATAEAAQAIVELDSGPRLLVDSAARVTIAAEDSVGVGAGRAYAESHAGDALSIAAGGALLRAADAALSIEAREGGATVYVVRGEVSWRRGDERGVARAGEELALTDASAAITPAVLWNDWTGGLVRPGPESETVAPGMGVLEARVPDEVGQARWALTIRRLDVRVEIEGDLAITEVEQEFFNPASETVEGLYRVSVPERAVLQRFAVDREGQMVDGYVREQQQARAAYEAQVYRGSTDDPALLEWDAPGRYRARIYPIQPGEVRRIAIRYAEWLSRASDGGPRLYRYPMGGGERAPHVQELAFVADLAHAGAARVRAGMGATIERDSVVLRRSDFRPRSDLWLEIFDAAQAPQRAYRAAHEPPPRAPGSRAIVHEADERDYWYLPLVLPERLGEAARAEGLDLVVVADVSAATDRSHLELGRSVVESIVAHLGPRDRIAIVGADLAIRPLVAGDEAMALGPAEPARVEALLEGLSRVPAGGATDLGAAIAQAAERLDPSRAGAVVYVGDGAPTVGELGAEELIEHLARLPHPVRLYGVGVGADANVDLLSALTQGGGLSLRVEERGDAAEAALRVLAHAGRPLLARVTVDVGSGIDNVFPRRPSDVALGEVLSIVGRVRESPPSEVIVRGEVAGRPFEEHVAVVTEESGERTDLRLRWAAERLRQLLLEGASREEIAELGTRYGLITPYTSYYVPSARELRESGQLSRVEPAALATDLALAAVLGPLVLTGCSTADEPAASATPVTVAPSPQPQMPGGNAEGQMGRESADESASRSRYGVEEESAEPAPEAAREGGYYGDGEGAAAAAEAAPTPSPAMPMAPPVVAPPATGSSPVTTDQPYGGMALGDDRGEGNTGTGYGTIGTIGGGSGYGHGASGARVGGSSAVDALSQLDAQRRAAEPLADPHDLDERTRDRSARRAHESGSLGALAGAGFAGPAMPTETTTTVRTTTIVTTTVAADHARRRCSDAADRSLPDRQALWTERLSRAGGVYGWLEVYRDAVRDCEAPSWRDRRALLRLVLVQAGNLATMIVVYRNTSEGSARGFLRSEILRRVRSPEDLRLVRQAFGISGGIDWSLVEQVLARATTPQARLRALRELVRQTPDSFDLRLRLLEELEAQHRTAEALRLADGMRTDPLADAGVRTAIGEMYLRLEREDDARRVFSEIVEFAPLDELARRRLGDLYRAHGWFEDAYRQYATLSEIRPDDPGVLLLLAQAAAGAGRVDEALRLEQRLMETAEPGSREGIARIAQLWSSVRYAKLRDEARSNSDQARLASLLARMRRSGVLRGSGDLRVSLTWAHPDAQLALWAAHPGVSPTRPDDLAPELGIEAFDVAEQESGAYRVEVRRSTRDRLGAIEAELVVVWNEGRADEAIRVVPLRFEPGRTSLAWTITGTALAEAATGGNTPSGGN